MAAVALAHQTISIGAVTDEQEGDLRLLGGRVEHGAQAVRETVASDVRDHESAVQVQRCARGPPIGLWREEACVRSVGNHGKLPSRHARGSKPIGKGFGDNHHARGLPIQKMR